jgi:hypothetical protein
MIVPKFLVFITAYKLCACTVVSHLIGFTFEIGYEIKEVKRKKDHGCDHPFDGEDEEKYELISILTSDFR